MIEILLGIHDFHVGGIEKAMVCLLQELIKDSRINVTLMVIRKQGEYLKDLPEKIVVQEINMCDIDRNEQFFSSKELCVKYIKKLQIGKLLKLFGQSIYLHSWPLEKKISYLWSKYDKSVPCCERDFDIAIDFQGQGTFMTYYIANKINAERKYTWVHNDFSVGENRMEWAVALFDKFDGIVSVSQAAKDIFDSLFPSLKKKTSVCYNIMSCQNILEMAEQETVSKANGVNIVTVGRISYQKGYDYALWAMKQLKNEGYKFTYWIVGDGECREEMQYLSKQYEIDDCVRFTGFQHNPYKYMKMCDIYLQPSRFEGFCLTIGEAKLLQKVIVTTDFAGAREQIIDGKTGVIVDSSKEAILAGIKKIMDNSDLRNSIAENIKSEWHSEGLEQFYQLIDLPIPNNG